MSQPEIGVLLMAYGSPRSLDEVEAYLTDIRGGRQPSPEAVDELKSRYDRIGGTSPLNRITLRQAEELEAFLNAFEPDRYQVFVGMKHWHPFISEAVSQIATSGIKKVIGVVLAPHYSKISIGGYETKLDSAKKEQKADFESRVISSWYDEAGFIDLVASNIRMTLDGWDSSDRTRVFFTAHSLPARILEEGDPYQDQLQHSSKLIAEAASIPDWEFAFQSASHTGEPWLGPDILEQLESFAAEGGRRAVIAPIGFTADHLEILYDIDIECAEKAAELGLEMKRIVSPNSSRAFTETLAKVVASALRKRAHVDRRS